MRYLDNVNQSITERRDIVIETAFKLFAENRIEPVTMTVVANKFKGVRAASVTSVAYAKAAKADDDINLLTLSGDNTTIKEAIEMINAWLETEFKGGRYKERLDMLEKIENENMK